LDWKAIVRPFSGLAVHPLAFHDARYLIILQMLVASIPELLHCAGSAFQNKALLSALLFNFSGKLEWGRSPRFEKQPVDLQNFKVIGNVLKRKKSSMFCSSAEGSSLSPARLEFGLVRLEMAL
jgi:hypothetical protein